jgi:hypothetical protein
MTRTAVFIIGAVLALSTPSAHAGPCSEDIAQFENTVRNSAGNPDAGPTLPQSVGAQLGHQPTERSVKRAEARAQRRLNTRLARAKQLDAQGSAQCAKALNDAKQIFAPF